MVNLQKGLVGHWTFDAGATNNSTAYDSSAYDNHGNIGSGVSTGVSGRVNKSVNLDGSSSGKIDVGFDNTLSEITVSGWVNLDSKDGWARLIDCGSDNNNYVFLCPYSGGGNPVFEISVSGNKSRVENSTTLSTNSWHHMAGTYNGSVGKLFLNGTNIEQNSFSPDISSLDFSNSNIGESFYSDPFLNASVDDLRVYDRALSESEISALYNMRSQRQQNAIGLPHTQNLLLHLNARNKLSVDESNNRWYDISGNNYEAHGTDGDGSINDNNFPDWEAKNGGRFILNGSEGWNVPGPIDTSGQVTLESWFYRTDLSSDTEYLSDARNGTGDWHLTNYQGYNVNFNNDLEMNDPSGGDYGDTGATSSPSSNLFNRWTHLVATSDGNISEIYIDGEKITDSRLQRDNPFPTGIGKDFAIANRYTGSAHLQGYMSVYRIYDDVLTPAQVKSNYESEKIYYK